MVIRDMRKLITAGDIANRINALVTRAQRLIYLNAFWCEDNTSFIKTKAVNIHLPASRYQQVRTGNRLLLAVFFHHNVNMLLDVFDTDNFNAFVQGQALLDEMRA